MKNIIIRNIKEEDIPKVVDIQISGWQTAYKGIIDDETLNKLNREDKINQRQKDYKDTIFIVAEINDDIVGFCRYIDSNKYTQNIPEIDCEIMALYAKPDLKYNGIGTKLFQFAYNEFKNNNKTKMIIWCLKDNEPAKKFYKKMGGKIIGEKEIKIDNKTYYEVGFLYTL